MENDYEVTGVLGEGSFGKVYKARHRKNGSDVAVKQIKLGSRTWSEACSSAELQALKALRHPFIVRLKELIRSQKDGSLYYIFEFMDSDLCRLLKQHKRGLEELRTAQLMRQLLAGLAHMHQHNFFHRDIKPENILLDVSTETIRLADFGQARSLRARPPFTDYVGTRWYRAPEVLLSDRTYSSPVDIWACGLIFAELLRGTPIFCGTSSIDQLHRIFTVLGQPITDWPEFTRLAQMARFRIPDKKGCGLSRVLPDHVSSHCQAFLSDLLSIHPRRRPMAKKCIEHSCFGKLPPLDLDRLGSTAKEAERDAPELAIDDKTILLDESRVDADVPSTAKSIAAAESIAKPKASFLDDDLDLDAELDAILGDDDSTACDIGGSQQAATSSYSQDWTPPLSQRAESSQMPGTASSESRNAAPSRPAFHHSSTMPELTSRGSGQPSVARSNSQPQSKPTLSPNGDVCVDALLDSLCAELASPQKPTEITDMQSQPTPFTLDDPNPPVSIDDAVPFPPQEDPLPLPVDFALSSCPSVQTADPPKPKQSSGMSGAWMIDHEESDEEHDLSVLPLPEADACSSSVNEESRFDKLDPSQAVAVDDASPYDASPCTVKPSFEAPRTDETEQAFSDFISKRSSSEELADAPVVESSVVDDSSSQAFPDFLSKRSSLGDVTSETIHGAEIPTSPPISSAEISESPPGEAAWPWTPENATSVNGASSEGSPLAHWQPTARAFQTRAVSKPEGRGLVRKPTTPLLPESPASCSSKADSEAEIILPGLSAPKSAPTLEEIEDVAEEVPTIRSLAGLPARGETAARPESVSKATASSLAAETTGTEQVPVDPPDKEDACIPEKFTSTVTVAADTPTAAHAPATTSAWVVSPAIDPDADDSADEIDMPRKSGSEATSASPCSPPDEASSPLRSPPEMERVEKVIADKAAMQELAALRAENEALRQKLAAEEAEKSALAKGLQDKMQRSLRATEEISGSSSSSRAKVDWPADEAAKLRRLVKQIVKEGTRDKDVLWAEVCSKLGTGRSARECKLQYARDYRAHKAKSATAAEEKHSGDAGNSSAVIIRKPSKNGSLGIASDDIHRPKRLPKPQSLPEPLSHSGLALPTPAKSGFR